MPKCTKEDKAFRATLNSDKQKRDVHVIPKHEPDHLESDSCWCSPKARLCKYERNGRMLIHQKKDICPTAQ